MNKKHLREKYKLIRRSIPQNDKDILDSGVYKNVMNSNFVHESNKICIFISFGSELDTHKIIKSLIELKKEVYVPITNPKTKCLDISRIYSFDDLEIGFYNILTPKKSKIHLIDKNKLDIVFTPGLIFDKRGYRIGFGGGYYDRFFSNLNPSIAKVGLVYSQFVTDRDLPIDEYDEKINFLITEKNILALNS